MGYTDQDVERVAEAIKRAAVDADGTYPMGTGRFYAAQARAALEVMEREPLEDVLDAIGGYVSEVGRNPGHTDGWQAVVVKEPYQHFGTGATIDEAIRAAIAAANPEKEE